LAGEHRWPGDGAFAGAASSREGIKRGGHTICALEGDELAARSGLNLEPGRTRGRPAIGGLAVPDTVASGAQRAVAVALCRPGRSSRRRTGDT
jgi:hypothetical protein